MSLSWKHESAPIWDAAKAEILGAVPAGTFQMDTYLPDAPLPGDWWRVEDEGAVAGYGWMDTTWGDAQILLVVAPGRRCNGTGAFILDRLEAEAASRGLNYLFNTVSPTHPDAASVTRWLRARKFEPSGEGTLRRPTCKQ